MGTSRLKEVLLRWFFPQTCAHCREDLADDGPGPLCPPCREALPAAFPVGCLRCSVPKAGAGGLCPACARSVFACRLIRSAYLYRGPAVSLVHSFKFRGRRSAARAAGAWMSRRLELFPELAGFEAVVPVPLHPSRLVERGYNQALTLAEAVGAGWDAPVLDVLRRRKKTRPQWRLGRAERKENLRGAFAAAEAAAELVRRRRLLLIDDVATTTASLEACARVLQEAGADWVGAMVLARQTGPGARGPGTS